MSAILHPANADELRAALHAAAAAGNTVDLHGANSKHLMAGPIHPADQRISTTSMRRILNYEPRDLTISVEAGLPYTELSRELARNGQMIPLAGAYSDEATIGGIVASNSGESRRRGYGAARDLVIGMEFATLEGKLVRSGGMVVKNVAGLDMAKLMIGSFGTLAAIATINFKLTPIPTVSRTLVFSFPDAAQTFAAFNAIMNAGLNPLAADILNPALAAQFNRKGHVLAIQFGGNDAVIERSTREATALAHGGQQDNDENFWITVANTTRRHLEAHPSGAIARISTPLTELKDALATLNVPAHAMAASGILRGAFPTAEAAAVWLNAAAKRNWRGIIEFTGPAVDRRTLTLWPGPGGDFEIMKKIKDLFDPRALLNRGRLHGRL